MTAVPEYDRSTPTRFWDQHYRTQPTTNTPRSTPLLAQIVAGATPGAALDLGCGAGGDALALAAAGWRVTAVDVSTVAIARLRDRAAGLDLADALVAEVRDLGDGPPDGLFDLISAVYLHTPLELSRTAVLRGAADRLTPGGRLVVIDHGVRAPWSWDPDGVGVAPADLAHELALDPQWFAVERADRPRRTATGPAGQTAQVSDHVLVVRRTGR